MTRGAAYQVDVIAGDGIGQEVMPAAIACVDALAADRDFTVTWRERDWGSDHYRAHGRMMPSDGIDQLADGNAILLGAVGAPDIPDDVTLWGLLIPIRREFLQYVNLRPVRILPGVSSPLRNAEGWTWSSSGRTSRASTPRSAGASTADAPRRWRCRKPSSPAAVSPG